ncbi:hypothetical protein [uncultured Paludibaculum sp.]|uniref:hypothetical protein n=1 Tax=uncultured Paludibaculum sp. TaxID=1765020 RepID=UPI002AAAE966|nr:hypothetical protein [uncultured Paludibaculum sp.]
MKVVRSRPWAIGQNVVIYRRRLVGDKVHYNPVVLMYCLQPAPSVSQLIDEGWFPVGSFDEVPEREGPGVFLPLYLVPIDAVLSANLEIIDTPYFWIVDLNPLQNILTQCLNDKVRGHMMDLGKIAT